MESISAQINSLIPYDSEIDYQWRKEHKTLHHKIIVLDDDPTGVQTVHGVPVYTDWDDATIKSIFADQQPLHFILTNSRAFTEEKTEIEHTKIAERIAKYATASGQNFLLISRGDSTLRGHYPLETEVLKETLEANSAIKFDGEIIIPFFQEGGRLTLNDIHYVKEGKSYIPVGETEFANDSMFAFTSSNLKQWIEEKTAGQYDASSVSSVSIEELRTMNLSSIDKKIAQLSNFNKLIVNAVIEDDLKPFAIALTRVMNREGKNFVFRTAASFTKVIGNITNKPYLTKQDLLQESNEHGGLIIVGSHVQKTTEQLNELKTNKDIHFLEFDCHVALNNQHLQEEIDRIQLFLNKFIQEGKTVCVYTSREKINLDGDKDEDMHFSLKIAQAITSFVTNCASKPKYVIAKGGITSSDIGTVGLSVKKAEVMGQVAPGVPVWETGNDSRFPNIPFIIFPGNVGSADTLKDVIKLLED